MTTLPEMAACARATEETAERMRGMLFALGGGAVPEADLPLLLRIERLCEAAAELRQRSTAVAVLAETA